MECKEEGEAVRRAARNGFNRYIVECKAERVSVRIIDQRDLIDTLWNVKWHMDESRKHLLIKR